MRIALIVITCLWAMSSQTQSKTANEMLVNCEHFLSNSQFYPNNRFSYSQDEQSFSCLNYFYAVQDFAYTSVANINTPNDFKTLLNACLPNGVGTIQIIRIFVEYAHRHPERLHEAMPLPTMEALLAAFPCRR